MKQLANEISALLHGDACVFDDFSPTVQFLNHQSIQGLRWGNVSLNPGCIQLFLSSFIYLLSSFCFSFYIFYFLLYSLSLFFLPFPPVYVLSVSTFSQKSLYVISLGQDSPTLKLCFHNFQLLIWKTFLGIFIRDVFALYYIN